MPKLTLRLISVALLPIVVFILLGLSANRFRVVEVEVGSSSSTDLASLRGYRFALVSDPHLKDTPSAWRSWEDVIHRVNASGADYVFLLGDYTQEVLDDRQLEGFRARFIESLTAFTTSPILVLGNHETWNDRQVWYAELERSGFDVLENEAISIPGDRPLCVIGVGDAQKRLAEKTTRFSEMLGVSPRSVSIKDLKTKWGSCSKNGDIAYNWKIIMASNNLVDYVVMHELCHLKELNHSARFWKLLDRHKPDWRECKFALANL